LLFEVHLERKKEERKKFIYLLLAETLLKELNSRHIFNCSLYQSSKIKSIKKSQINKNKGYFLLVDGRIRNRTKNDGSGSGRPKT
jgi:hypothetical protein